MKRAKRTYERNKRKDLPKDHNDHNTTLQSEKKTFALQEKSVNIVPLAASTPAKPIVTDYEPSTRRHSDYLKQMKKPKYSKPKSSTGLWQSRHPVPLVHAEDSLDELTEST